MRVKLWEFAYLLMTLSFNAIQCFLYLRQVLCSGTLKRFNSFALKMAAPSPTIARKPVILCVEDNEIYLRLRKAVLEQAGCAVLSATTGTEAMEILRDAPVCLVLSDHMLRGTTGTLLAKQMKKIKRNVPIILYSGKPPKSMRNVDGFINKDESVARFLSLIGDFVKRYRE